MPPAIEDLFQKVRYLLEWMPICSEGSSGHKRRVAVEESMRDIERMMRQINLD